jgi:hypothetical protein
VVKNLEVQPPKVFTGQAELYNKLMENGIEVYVMTAASENWCAWSRPIRSTATTSNRRT